ncbi:N-acetylmuramoyl-L-alanine amidase [Peribacillus asahii]|uniref:N-acetylmuramoyl-L-alanine amidase n=1 Tax=Peribacillus asahii TaxID=228899 RepID=A0A398BC41_9BACI|nr:N-acetylmuramoyl-L-alanine amidase [Peribacillus asahii]
MSSLKQKWTILTLALLIIFIAFPHAYAFSEQQKITATSNSVNVRAGAGLSFPVIGQLTKGEEHVVIKEEGDWIQIKLSAAKTGWVANWLVEKTEAVNQTTEQGTIIGDSVRIRTGPGTSFQTIGSLSHGTAVSITITDNENWLEIKTDHVQGWVAKQYVQLSATGQTKKAKESKAKAEELYTGLVNVDQLNVRLQPSTSGALLGKLAKNSEVTVYQEEGSWVQIDFQNQKGWVLKQYIQTKDTASSGATAKVLAPNLAVHKEASLTSSLLGEVKKNESYPIIKEKGYLTQIQFNSTKKGWVANWFLEKEEPPALSSEKKKVTNGTISIMYDDTLIREKPTANSAILKQTKEGDTFSVTGLEDDWYKVKWKSGKTGYVAGWMVSIDGHNEQVTRPGVEKYLKDKVIIIDPGHGGRDGGTIGLRGTLEKHLTSRTAKLLYDKLHAAGADVILTRSTDTYVPLPSRVSISHIHNADAFISLHYDSTVNLATSGITTYYYHGYQQALASSINYSLASALQVENRGQRLGNYHVLRENKRAAALVELGYLSNPADELIVTTNDYQENVTSAIYNGLARYFK